MVAALETWPAPCGRYTTWPSSVDIDVVLCPSLQPLSSGEEGDGMAFGIATRISRGGNASVTALDGGEFRVVDFEGYFQGRAGGVRVGAFVGEGGVGG